LKSVRFIFAFTQISCFGRIQRTQQLSERSLLLVYSFKSSNQYFRFKKSTSIAASTHFVELLNAAFFSFQHLCIYFVSNLKNVSKKKNVDPVKINSTRDSYVIYYWWVCFETHLGTPYNKKNREQRTKSKRLHTIKETRNRE